MSRNSELLLGGLFVAVAIILNFSFMGPAIIALNAGLIIAYFVRASNISDTHVKGKRILFIYSIGIVVQILHFFEEYSTGFQTRFPVFFGYQWSDNLYVAFNSIWLFLFFLATWGVYKKVRLAYIIVWFFALIAGIGNGLFHPVVSIFQGGYFPGLITSPFLLVIGILLVRELTKKSVTVRPFPK